MLYASDGCGFGGALSLVAVADSVGLGVGVLVGITGANVVALDVGWGVGLAKEGGIEVVVEITDSDHLRIRAKRCNIVDGRVGRFAWSAGTYITGAGSLLAMVTTAS